MQNHIKQQFIELAEEDYRRFSSKLLPNVENILGIRIPLLRKLAKQLIKEDWRNYLRTAQEDSFEEIMLQGLVIGYAPCSVEERLCYIKEFVPKINNWSVCDSFCSGLKFTQKNREPIWEFLQPYLDSDKEFDVRFAVVMLLCYYIEEPYIDTVLHTLDSVTHDGYYAKMAVAWAVSICYVKFPHQTMEYLNHSHLDDFTYNKALQKITESLKVDKLVKKQLQSMKRKPMKGE